MHWFYICWLVIAVANGIALIFFTDPFIRFTNARYRPARGEAAVPITPRVRLLHRLAGVVFLCLGILGSFALYFERWPFDRLPS